MVACTVRALKEWGALGAYGALVIFALTFTQSSAGDGEKGAPTTSDASPIYGIAVPDGYRGWQLISVAHEEGNLNDIRAQLGNEVAMAAYQQGTRPFPDGTVIAALHWEYLSSQTNNQVFGRAQSFVAGAAKNVQFMVKDSKKYADTGGWGFADFTNGKPASNAAHETCFPCHKLARDRDMVFTQYAAH